MQCPKIQITFTPEQLEALKKIAKSEGNSVSAIVRMLVTDYLAKRELKNGTN
jgi:hypothetical protein